MTTAMGCTDETFMGKAQECLMDVVVNQLRPVSYKWLARSMQATANEAKGAMAAFVEGEGTGKVDSLWVVGGWVDSPLVNEPRVQVLSIVANDERAAARAKLAEVTTEHVYSVQPSGAGPCAYEAWNEERQQSAALYEEEDRNAFHDNRCSGVQSAQVRWESTGASERRVRKDNSTKEDNSRAGGFCAGPKEKDVRSASMSALGVVRSGVASTKKVSTERAAKAATKKEMAVKPPNALHGGKKTAGEGEGDGQKQKGVAAAPERDAQTKVPAKAKTASSNKARMASMFAKAPPPKPSPAAAPVDDGFDEDDDFDEEDLALSRRSRLEGKSTAATVTEGKPRVRGRGNIVVLEDDDEDEDEEEAPDGEHRADVSESADDVGEAPTGGDLEMLDAVDIECSKENLENVGIAVRTIKKRKMKSVYLLRQMSKRVGLGGFWRMTTLD